MTAFSRYELHCDADGCVERFDSGDKRATDTRRHAIRGGWVFGVRKRKDSGPAPSIDLCPTHADQIDPASVVKL